MKKRIFAALAACTMLLTGCSAGQSAEFILGSSSASFLWFMGITVVISLFSAHFNDKVLRVINCVCGVAIIFYGAKLLLNFVELLGVL